MAASSHTTRQRRTKHVYRDDVASRRHGERTEDIKAACHLWLLKRAPGYREEYEFAKGRAPIQFGKGEQ